MLIPGYDVLGPFAASARFTVYRGRRQGDGRPMLLQVPTRTPVTVQDVEELDRQLALATDDAGSSLVSAHELNRRGDLPCLVRLDEGLDTLQARAASHSSLGWVLRAAVALTSMLQSLHDRGIVAGSLAPTGVLIDHEARRARLLDLDLAARASAEGTVPPSTGRPTAYMSPEQTGRLNRAVDDRSDFYGLGATLYELLTGRRACPATEPLEIIHFHIAKTPVAPVVAKPGTPEQISHLVMRLLAKDPDDRYQSASGLRHDLERCLSSLEGDGSITPFPLGQRDVSNRFVVPRRLYGREQETAALRRAFEHTCTGGTALVLVGGFAGVGKTSLVNDLHRPIVRQRGAFTTGKFDQVVRDIPYGALAEAFRHLVRQLLGAREDRLANLRGRLLDALGVNAGVIAEVIPEIELIIGAQPPPPPLDPVEAQNRFGYLFQLFVATLAGEDHPLVLFLDDLQWADAATLALLHALLASRDISHFLVIGAYRDNDVDDTPLVTWAGRIEAAGTRVLRLVLRPLGRRDLLLFLADALRATHAELEPLAELIRAKTDGNPFFVIQFLRTLVQDGLVGFDPVRAVWTFRLEAVREAQFTDNVIELMTHRIQRLSPRAQRALTLAACVGNRFTWDTLAVVSREAPDAVAAGLFEALEAGLIQRSEEPFDEQNGAPARVGYAFLHDRVQQAAYGLIPDDRKRPVHLDVGRLLLASAAGEVPDGRLFEVVNHLNVGSPLINDPAERLHLARLNLAAGRKARASMAYQSAASHLEQGLRLATDAAWQGEYDLAYALHLEAAEAHYLAGSFDVAERLFRVLLERAATPVDRARVHALRITLYENQSRWADAVASGRDGVAEFGIALPTGVDATREALDRELELTDQLTAGRTIGSLVDLPRATDAETLTLMRLLSLLWAPAYVSGNARLARLISATMVRWSIERGHTVDSAYGYVTHAITVGAIRGDYESAFAWGQLALAVCDRFDDPRPRARIYQQFHAHVNFWRQPFETCLPYAREARRAGLETGDFVYAGYGAASEAWPAFLCSRDLEAFVQDYTPTLALLEKVRMQNFRDGHRVVLNWAQALRGRTAGLQSLTNADLDEAAFISTYEDAAPFFLTFPYVAHVHLALMAEDWPRAVEHWRRVRKVAAPGTIWPAVVDGWGALALVAQARDAHDPHWPELLGLQRVLERQAINCPENFRVLWLLLCAGLERCRGHVAAAIRLCDEAADHALQAGSLQQEALAAETGARLRRATGDEAGADAARQRALRTYAAWGAVAKVRQLEREHTHLIPPHTEEMADRRPAARDSEDASAVSVDMATVLKVAQAIAVEIRLDDLLRTLLALAMENAGARRAVFLAIRDGVLTVEAEACADPETVTIARGLPLDAVDRLPHTIVQYVRRTGQDVVIGNAVSEDRFAADPYVAAGAVRSLLCVPVSHQGRLGGVLYLENDLTADAFTPQRAELMRILAAQAAIALENARLYADMAAEVQRRTTVEGALREALDEVEGLKNRLQAENVYLQEEIQTQHNFTDIVGNSPALREALRQVEHVAATGSTVLITGETGTGKEIIARAIHSRSTRRGRPLVKVNCGAIPAGLVESELFGHVKGAFTGALQRRSGRFELADGGSIFLDEVGELPLETQVKLLRVLQEQEFEPVGASRAVRVDVRVIAATNRDLVSMVRAGSFRADLFYRLNVFPIAVPPLRERRSDIPLLVTFFLSSLSKRLGKRLEGFTAASLARLEDYSWPGNVRELQNLVERASILATGPVIDLSPGVLPHTPPLEPAATSGARTLEAMERHHILRVVREANWVIEGQRGAAVVLGLHPNTLRSRMKKLGIVRPPSETS